MSKLSLDEIQKNMFRNAVLVAKELRDPQILADTLEVLSLQVLGARGGDARESASPPKVEVGGGEAKKAVAEEKQKTFVETKKNASAQVKKVNIEAKKAASDTKKPANTAATKSSAKTAKGKKAKKAVYYKTAEEDPNFISPEHLAGLSDEALVAMLPSERSRGRPSRAEAAVRAEMQRRAEGGDKKKAS